MVFGISPTLIYCKDTLKDNDVEDEFKEVIQRKKEKVKQTILEIQKQHTQLHEIKKKLGDDKCNQKRKFVWNQLTNKEQLFKTARIEKKVQNVQLISFRRDLYKTHYCAPTSQTNLRKPAVRAWSWSLLFSHPMIM